MKIGAKILDTIDDVIGHRDKVLLVLSEASISSEWVENEVTKAFEEERRRGRGTIVLFPIRLDDEYSQPMKPGPSSCARATSAISGAGRSTTRIRKRWIGCYAT